MGFFGALGATDGNVRPESRDMVSPDKEIVFHRKEYKELREVHYTRGL